MFILRIHQQQVTTLSRSIFYIQSVIYLGKMSTQGKSLQIWTLSPFEQIELKTYLFACLWKLLNKSGILGGSVLLCLVGLLMLACMQQTQAGKEAGRKRRKSRKKVYRSAWTTERYKGGKKWHLIQ